METMINKANEIIKNANFTKVKKARKNLPMLFLIVALSDGSAIYGSYSSETYYIQIDSEMFRLS